MGEFLLSEDDIVEQLREGRWLRDLFGLVELESRQYVAWLPEKGGMLTSKQADLVGVNVGGKVFSFEVKGPGHDIGSAFDQVCAYCRGSNFVYCVLYEDSVSETSLEKFRKTGIGLITYSLKGNRIDAVNLMLVSEEQGGKHVDLTLQWFKKIPQK